jgi:hypothetical protein
VARFGHHAPHRKRKTPFRDQSLSPQHHRCKCN